MNMWIMIMIILVVIIAAIVVVFGTNTEGVLKEKGRTVENFNNPNVMSLSGREKVTVDCPTGSSSYRITISNFRIDYKLGGKMRIDMTAKIFNTEYTYILDPVEHKLLLLLPMQNSITIQFSAKINDYDVIGSTEDNKLGLTLLFWKDETDDGCYHLNRGKPADEIIQKCTDSYLGSVDMFIPVKDILHNGCQTEWIMTGDYIRTILLEHGENAGTYKIQTTLVSVKQGASTQPGLNPTEFKFRFFVQKLEPSSTGGYVNVGITPKEDGILCNDIRPTGVGSDETYALRQLLAGTPFLNCGKYTPGFFGGFERIFRMYLNKIDSNRREITISIEPLY